ncbi:MAG: hypothetical protein AB1772_10340 [Candidatus Zixiibacteriota bacterium]
MIRSIIPLVLATALSAAAQEPGDPFEQVKANMIRAACCRFEFLSIIESQVFESVDTTEGMALIAADGRYFIRVGSDQYLKTADKLYSYSGQENQVTVEVVSDNASSHETVSFVTRLDDYYSASERTPDREYYLARRDSSASNLPDSMIVVLTGKKPRLERLEYYDINDDLNRIVFTGVEYLDRCDGSTFMPRFPDSAQVINLQ